MLERARRGSLAARDRSCRSRERASRDLNPHRERPMFSADTEGVSAPSGLYGSQPGVDQADSARERAVS